MNMRLLSFKSLSQSLWLAICLCIASQLVLANDEPAPTMPENAVNMMTITPERDVAYTVGDIVERTIILNVKKPYKLIPTSLPIVGYERRYKGQVTGIELRKIEHSEVDNTDSTTYTIKLAHQVFTNNTVAKFVFLPAETLRFTSDKKGEIVQYRIPEWMFRVSPIAVYGSVELKDDMSPLRKPFLLDATADKKRLNIALVALGLSLLGLLYILGKRAWLPLMGRPFARTYRQLGKLNNTPEGIQLAISKMHEALNNTAGFSVFSNNLDTFTANQPSFKPVQAEIEQFFGLSRRVFFDTQTSNEISDDPIIWLKQFCKQCRDCERGLRPETRLKAAK
jgi:mxaA protein